MHVLHREHNTEARLEEGMDDTAGGAAGMFSKSKAGDGHLWQLKVAS